jgi:CheY-like chemotaxis protein
MFVLAVGFEAAGEGPWPRAEALSPSLLAVNVGNEADMLAALDFACFDAIVIDLDRQASWMFDIIKLERFATAADAGLPAIGCASAIDQPLRERCSDAGIRLIVDKPVNPQQLSDHLQQACGAAAALGA